MKPYPPLGTLHAAAYVREKLLVDPFDAESESEWTTALEKHKPRYAVIYEDCFTTCRRCAPHPGMRQAAFIRRPKPSSAVAPKAYLRSPDKWTTRTHVISSTGPRHNNRRGRDHARRGSLMHYQAKPVPN